jgi:hypothetical protein
MRAYFSGDRREFEARTRRLFALPEPESWLTRAFGPARAVDLAADYRKHFKAFQSSFARNLERWRGADDLTLQAWALQTLPSRDRMMPRPDAPVPQESVDIRRFQFTLRASGRAPSQWVDSFVYDDGAFRFIGRGAFPFWDHPLVLRLDTPASPAGPR